jgi:hypothetical protein
MAESEFGKYIITELKQNIEEASWTNPIQAAGKGRGGRLLFLDNEVIPGSFYVETAWSAPQGLVKEPRIVAEAHKHNYDKSLQCSVLTLSDPTNKR